MKERPTHPAALRFAVLATDIALLTVKDGELLVRLIRVDRPPYFNDTKGLPGGLIDPKETAEDAARRHVRDKACMSTHHIHMEQLYTFSAIDRDPRGRVVAVAYLALVPWNALTEDERKNTQETWWTPLKDARKLAYDHDEILTTALARLQSKVRYSSLIKALMPEMFTLTELEQVYESVIKTDLDKRNFRKKILKLKLVTPTKEKRTGGAFRPALLYRFTSKKITDIEIL